MTDNGEADMSREMECWPHVGRALLVGCLLLLGCDVPGTKRRFTNTICMKMVLIPAGEFQMGSKLSAKEVAARYGGKAEWFVREHPRHTVEITNAFYIGATEVTQAQYEALMADNPSNPKGPNLPVAKVSWHEAVEFCKRLSAKEGKTYRLPTEAEWEYACRAGSTTEYCFGDDKSRLSSYAWYDKNSDDQAHRVRKKKPNAWGLYDMHGNVFEWCADWYVAGYHQQSPVKDPKGLEDGGLGRVLRGGNWVSRPYFVRSAHRGRFYPDHPANIVGFRVVLAAQ